MKKNECPSASPLTPRILLPPCAQADVLGAGHSRIPVFRGDSRHNVIGVLMVKKLIVLNPAEHRPIKGMALRHPLLVHPDAGLLDTLNAFQVGKCHLVRRCRLNTSG